MKKRAGSRAFKAEHDACAETVKMGSVDDSERSPAPALFVLLALLPFTRAETVRGSRKDWNNSRTHWTLSRGF